MADSPPVITEDEYRRWLEPSATLALVYSKIGNYQKAYAAILKRGGAGLIRAAAKRIDAHDAGGKISQSSPYPVVAPGTLKSWHDHYGHSDLGLWSSGDCELTLDVPMRHGYGAATPHLAYYGIRFEPSGIHELAGQQAGTTSAAPAVIPTAAIPAFADEPETRGSPISQAALEAWFKAYQMAFTGTQDTEAKAMESAKGCFPGKSFSREAVRALRGEQKRGPKGKTAK